MMFPTVTTLVVLAAAGLVSAQTPAGFEPAVTARLDLVFGSKVITAPGTSLTKAETAKQPTIGTSDVALNGTYLWMMIDLDVPANFQNPSAGGRRTNLHAMIQGFKPSSSAAAANGVFTLASSGTAGPITYTGPSPPAEKPAYPHRYVSLLYETPASFSVTKAQVGQTFGFNLTTFVASTKLSLPIRANYFTVTG
ncbi:phosphatidylethanolamine-binding protein [Podospora didyma]|uniref:Phosphatidylethanolamine-binding protein n=1 Tax=Podospora didyma TaxID=330526 RepID=A0AAE0N3Z4_9PEZI|nr:phosphatidylethanolamine-binding protein [Podospora didyma]